MLIWGGGPTNYVFKQCPRSTYSQADRMENTHRYDQCYICVIAYCSQINSSLPAAALISITMMFTVPVNICTSGLINGPSNLCYFNVYSEHMFYE